MRLLDIITEAENNFTVVIGDSIAVGIAKAAGLPETYAVGGRPTSKVLDAVREFVATGRAKGATVILSSGASNSTYDRPNGESKALDTGPIAQQIKALKDAGATVFLVGTGSRRSKTITNKYGQYFVNFEGQHVNEKLAAVAKQYGATFLGPLENYDSGLNTAGDGIHPGGAGARKIFSAVQNPSSIPNRDDTQSQTDTDEKGYKKSVAFQTKSDAPADTINTIYKSSPQTGMDKFLSTVGDKLSGAGNAVKDKVAAGASAGYNFLKGKKKNPVSPDSIKQYLSTKGLDKNQIAGILANIQHESGFDSGAVGDSGTSGGLVQHHANRFQSMVAASGGPNQWASNWQAQLDYALSEPAGQQYRSLKFTSPEQASKWWTINFEVPANKYAQANIRSAVASRYA